MLAVEWAERFRRPALRLSSPMRFKRTVRPPQMLRLASFFWYQIVVTT